MIKKEYSSFPGWARVLVIILPWFFVVGLFQLIGFLFLGLNLAGYATPKTPFENLVLSLFSFAGTFVIVWIFRRWVDRESFRSMGFYSSGILRESVAGLVLGAVILSAGFTILIFLGEIQWVGTKLQLVDFLSAFLLFVVIAITEELFCRGYILNNLMKSMHPFRALLVSSLFFSLLHFANAHYSWISFLDLLLAGVLMGLPYIYTKSLWLPIALHFSWNFFEGPVFGFEVSGNTTYSIMTQSRPADTFLNGGSFGFEGSVFSIVFQLIAIFFLWQFYRKRYSRIRHSQDSLLPTE